MIVKRTICVVLGLLLLVGIAAAIDLTPSTISNSNTGWLIANGADTTTITVFVMQAPSSPLNGANVAFSVVGATGNGSVSPSGVTTGTDGKATTTFRTGTMSGDISILATLTFNDGSTTPVTIATHQLVDHGKPEYAIPTYPATATVGNVTQITVALTDINHNPIDNKNPAGNHPVVLDSSTDGGAGFFDGSAYVFRATLMPGPAGTNTTDYRLSTVAGKNYFMVQVPDSNIAPELYYITGIGGSTPAYITQTYPSPNVLPANGAEENFFTIDYFITDEYGNPASTTLLFTANDGTSSLKTSNPITGKVRAFFGPKDVSGFYTLMGATPANASVLCLDTGEIGNCNQIVEFHNTDPVDLTLTANPQGMASLDVDPASIAIIQARVVDIKGNPVTGQVVHFSNSTPTYPGGPYVETSPPSLSASDAAVSNGFAAVNFTPGAFATSGAGYNATATGEIVVTASWTDLSNKVITRNVTLVWKNYPYLSISSDAACTNSQVGDAINITIQLAGDGAALRPKPIDAMLVSDISSSMTGYWSGSTWIPSGNPIPGPDGPRNKLYYSRTAGTTFINKLNPTTDQVGVTKFCGSANVAHSLSPNFTNVNTSLWQGNSCSYTGTRAALKLAINDTAYYSTNPKAIKAIVLLTDGQYNIGGDPLARGTGDVNNNNWGEGSLRYYIFPSPYTGPQDMSQYAIDNDIVIYTITFGVSADEINSSATYEAMDLLASRTGGTHFHANDGGEVVTIYETIAGLLQDTAGGDTEIALDFGTVNINDNLLDANITDYMDYQWYHNDTLGIHPADSTHISKTRLENDGTTTLLNAAVQNDTDLWNNHKMDYDVGTIKLNETWRLNFRLNLTKAGKIELFGPASSGTWVKFNDSTSSGTQQAFIPAIQCNVLQTRSQNKGDANLTVFDLKDHLAAELTTQWPISWKTTYNGTDTAWAEIKYTVTHKPSLGERVVDSGWISFQGLQGSTYTYEQVTPFTISTADDTKWPPGEEFCIQIRATAGDVNGESRSNVICKTKQGTTQGQYIKLE